MKDTHKRLLEITAACREDMHEPDQQGLSARVIGDELDNAFGEEVTTGLGFQEYLVIIEKDGKAQRFNLATLIALARKAEFNDERKPL